jgi:hypothetical protein
VVGEIKKREINLKIGENKQTVIHRKGDEG